MAIKEDHPRRRRTDALEVRVDHLEEGVRDLKITIVTKQEFAPYRMLISLTVVIILSSVLLAVISMVIRGLI